MMYVCVNDGRALKVTLNGVCIEEMLSDTEPYKLWSSDLYACPECGFTVAITARLPIAEHYQRDYQDTVGRVQASMGKKTLWRFIQS